MSLARFLTRDRLKKLAGKGAFEAGEAYGRDKGVGRVEETEDSICAEVEGVETYKVEIRLDEGGFLFCCECKDAAEDAFCEHCVALGLAWIARRKPAKKVDAKTIRAYLSKLTKEELVELLVEQAKRDKAFRHQLEVDLLRGASDLGGSEDHGALVDAAFKSKGFIPYGGMRAYAAGASKGIEFLRSLVEDGKTGLAIDLTEKALKAAENTAVQCDDSAGYMNGIFDALEGIHLLACQRESPEPKALARRLFEWELNSSLSTFYDAANTYAKVLGSEGLKEYRRLATSLWEDIEPLGPGQREPERNLNRSRIARMMEVLAIQSGDLGELIAVLSKDLSSSHQFHRIAEACLTAGKKGEAMAWAKKGLDSFLDRPDARLEGFLATLYHSEGSHEKAMELVWRTFLRSPRLESYRLLHSHAATNDSWSEWRPKALKAILDRIENPKQGVLVGKPKVSSLVEIYLWEDELELAWEAFRQGTCSLELASRLADLRADSHPEDSVNVYHQVATISIGLTTNQGYADAVSALRKISVLSTKYGREADFKRMLMQIRVANKQKRKLIALLDREMWD